MLTEEEFVEASALHRRGWSISAIARHSAATARRVPDEVVVRAGVLALDDGERLETRHDREPRAHLEGREGLQGLSWLGGHRRTRPRALPAPHPSDELEDLPAPRVEEHDEVVVPELPDLDQARLGPVPGVLVVEDHRPAQEGLELGHLLGAAEDLLVRVGRVVGVVPQEMEGVVSGIGEDLGNGRLDRGQLRRVVPLVPEDVEQDPEDTVLGVGVPRWRQGLIRRLDGGDLSLVLLPGGQSREEESSRLKWCNARGSSVRVGVSGRLERSYLLVFGLALVLVDEDERERLR